DGMGSNPSVTMAYAEIVSGGQRRAVDAYRAVLAEQTRQSKQVANASAQAALAVATLQSDRNAAIAAMAARQQTLAQVQGRPATLAARAEAAQQQAEATAVKTTLAQEGQLPPPTPARVTLSLSRTSAAGTGRASTVGSARPTSSPASPV